MMKLHQLSVKLYHIYNDTYSIDIFTFILTSSNNSQLIHPYL